MNKMKEEYKDFIGIYDKSVPVELCNVFVENWEEAKKNRTIVDLSKENKTGILHRTDNPIGRKDEIAFIDPLSSTIYPVPPVHAYFDYLKKCFACYAKRYSILFYGALYNDAFKIHKVKQSEGYHEWHYEKSDPNTLDRVVVYMTYLEAPKSGGETEFLHQSLRIKPIVGRTLLWPAGFTHMHRGNPPLDGEKMYIDGWFTGGRTNSDNEGK
tara:strand:- start:73 stop:708 length:636 start_codon:yes stop_codon:yes gene_type:complete